MSAQIEAYGRTSDGHEVERVVLEDGLRVELLTYGGLIARLEVPGASGRRDNVVLGLPDLASYESRNPNFGVTVGRYAGRIGGGRFVLDGAEHRLPQNDGDNTLHGGRGFAKRVWRIERADRRAATLAYASADGEEGFPGALETRVTFTVEGLTLRLEYEAASDRATVLNLTNHSYFNLSGEGSGDVLGHLLQVEADRILVVDRHSLPTGALLDITGTPFDFRTPCLVGARIREAHEQIVFGLGYDACFVLRGEGMRTAATVRAAGGRVMRVRTDQPAVQVYSANKLTGALVGPSGRAYRAGDGLCLETQHFPDSPNRPEFPSTVLRPDEAFRSTTEYAFAIDLPHNYTQSGGDISVIDNGGKITVKESAEGPGGCPQL